MIQSRILDFFNMIQKLFQALMNIKIILKAKMPQKYLIKLIQKLFIKFVTPKFLQKKLKKTKNNQKFSSKKVLFNK